MMTENYQHLTPTLLFIVSTILVAIAALAPSPKWVSRNVPAKAGYGDPGKKRGATRFLLMTFLAMGTAVILIARGTPLLTSFIAGMAVSVLIVPLIMTQQQKKLEKKSRLEALRIAEYVAGRMQSSQASLMVALENLVTEHKSGGRSIPVCVVHLEATLRAVNLGGPLHVQLLVLADLLKDLPEMSGMWKKYAIMSDASLGTEAMAVQAEDLAKNLRIVDELRDTLETELTLSTMTRYFMFFLIGGFTLFLILSGGSLGKVLTETLAGNILIGFAAFLLVLAQAVGNRIEKMPPLWF